LLPGLFEELHRHEAMGVAAPGSQYGSDHGGFGQFLFSSAFGVGGVGMRLNAIRTLCGERNGDGHEFGVLAGDGIVLPVHYFFVPGHEGFKRCWCTVADVAGELVIGVFVVARGVSLSVLVF
jgi:hypothetical protein